jgi:hypothetical protein
MTDPSSASPEVRGGTSTYYRYKISHTLDPVKLVSASNLIFSTLSIRTFVYIVTIL